MMRLEYAGGAILTGADIAEAVVEYAAALARAETSMRVDVPGITQDGVEGTFTILLGPASQILVEPMADDRELVDHAFVAATRQATELLDHPPGIRPSEEPASLSADLEFE